MPTPDELILKLLGDWAPEITNLLKRTNYFSLPEGIKKELIAKAIGLDPGGKLYRQVLRASLEKNNKIWDIVLNEYSLREFKAGAREVAKRLNIPFSQWDWNNAAQDHFQKEGLKKVKLLTQTDLDSLRERIQYDFNLNPKAFAEKYAKSYSCSPARLERIKRTETHTESQAGGYGFAGDADCQFAQWMCSPVGEWPRPSHRAVWYEIVKYGEPFSNGLLWPSDPNCRCFLLYFIDETHLKWGAKKVA